MEFTGERHIPGAGGAELEYEHVHRYLFALPMVPGRRVLDVACGEGYGCDILARSASEVIGMDASEAVVEHARDKYGQRANIRFEAGDAQDIPLPNRDVDVITSFETLEHVPEPDVLLDELRRVLRPDGVLVISTPDRAVYSDARNYHNPFHEREFYRDEFLVALRSRFRSVELFGQCVTAVSAIWPLDGAGVWHPRVAGEAGDEGSEPAPGKLLTAVFLVAICTHDDAPRLPALDTSLYVDSQHALMNEYHRYVDIVGSAAEAVGDPARGVEDLIVGLKERLYELHHDHDAEILLANKRLDAADHRVAQLEAEAWTLKTDLEALRNTRLFRFSAPLRRLYGRARRS